MGSSRNRSRIYRSDPGSSVQATANWWEWLSSNASKLRDLALAGAAGAYALGFIIWSIHAFDNNLGLLPVLDSQYIIGGILPITLLGLLAVSAYLVIKRIHFNHPYVTLGIIVIFGVSNNVVIFFLNISSILETIFSFVVTVVTFTVMVISSSYNLPTTLKFLFYLASSWVIIWSTYLYALDVYPTIPHSLGGAKPRCAHLDVDISKISADSTSALFSTDGGTSIIRRSDALDIYYAGDNWILVKKAPPAELKDSDTYEIDRDAINAIIWC
jgi:hypothetical protein